MSDPLFSPANFILAHDLCESMSKNLEIDFQVMLDSMTREQAAEHFRRRQALIVVREMLIDEGERVSKLQP